MAAAVSNGMLSGSLINGSMPITRSVLYAPRGLPV
jgi:hypothetical protein